MAHRAAGLGLTTRWAAHSCHKFCDLPPLARDPQVTIMARTGRRSAGGGEAGATQLPFAFPALTSGNSSGGAGGQVGGCTRAHKP